MAIVAAFSAGMVAALSLTLTEQARQIRRERSTGNVALPGGAAVSTALRHSTELVDVVYTWVNGSDHLHLIKKAQARGGNRSTAHLLPHAHADGHGGVAEADGLAAAAGAGGADRRYATPFSRPRGPAVKPDSRDRDNGELRMSLRSLAANMRWHQGRVVIVSPGHVPRWLNLACPRVSVVHQDTLADDDASRWTFNTNTVENNMHALPGLSSTFVQFNDDYMVNRPTTPRHFFSEQGGALLRFEGGVVRGGLAEAADIKAKHKNVWVAGVYKSVGLVKRELGPAERHFVKHAPFVYCRKLLVGLRHLFAAEIEASAHERPFRSYDDVLLPFIFQHTVAAAPQQVYAAIPVGHPARQWPDCPAAESAGVDTQVARFFKLTDESSTRQTLADIRGSKSLVFFNLNDSFKSDVIPRLLWEFLSSLFPRPSAFENRPRKAAPRQQTSDVAVAATGAAHEAVEAGLAGRPAGDGSCGFSEDLCEKADALETADFAVAVDSCPALCATLRSLVGLGAPRVHRFARVFAVWPSTREATKGAACQCRAGHRFEWRSTYRPLPDRVVHVTAGEDGSQRHQKVLDRIFEHGPVARHAGDGRIVERTVLGTGETVQHANRGGHHIALHEVDKTALLDAAQLLCHPPATPDGRSGPRPRACTPVPGDGGPLVGQAAVAPLVMVQGVNPVFGELVVARHLRIVARPGRHNVNVVGAVYGTRVVPRESVSSRLSDPTRLHGGFPVAMGMPDPATSYLHVWPYPPFADWEEPVALVGER